MLLFLLIKKGDVVYMNEFMKFLSVHDDYLNFASEISLLCRKIGSIIYSVPLTKRETLLTEHWIKLGGFHADSLIYNLTKSLF